MISFIEYEIDISAIEDIKSEIINRISPLIISAIRSIGTINDLTETQEACEDKEKEIEKIQMDNENKVNKLNTMIDQQKQQYSDVSSKYTECLKELDNAKKRYDRLLLEYSTDNDRLLSLTKEYNDLVPASILPAFFNITPDQLV